MRKADLRTERYGRNLLTVVLSIVSIVYVIPVFMVLMNSFKLNTFVKTETFAFPTAESWAGFRWRICWWSAPSSVSSEVC